MFSYIWISLIFDHIKEVMSVKYNKSTLNNLEQIFKESEYAIRYEKGQFKSGFCLIHQKKIIIINKFFDIKGRIESLLDILSHVQLSENILSESSVQFLEVAKKFDDQRRKLVA